MELVWHFLRFEWGDDNLLVCHYRRERGAAMQLKIQRSQRMGGLMGNTVHFCLDVRADYAQDEAANIAKYKLGKEVVYNSRAAKKHLDSAGAHLDRTQDGGVGERAAGLVRGVASLALAAMNLNISIASLGSGHHIECKDLAELMEAEEAVMQACRNVRDYLQLAATFNGSTILVDFSQKDEQVHTAMGGEVYARPPASLPASAPTPAPSTVETQVTDAVFEEMAAIGASPDYPPGSVGPQFGNGVDGEALWNEVRSLYQAKPQLFWIGGGVVVGIFVLVEFGIGAFILASVTAMVGGFVWLNKRRA